MPLPSNIERSKFRKAEYVGYGSYATYSIKRGGAGWQTDRVWGYNKETMPSEALWFTAPTLLALSDKLCATLGELKPKVCVVAE